MSAEELFRKHIAAELRQYGGNIGSFLESVQNGDIPNEDEPTITQLIQELQKGLRKEGVVDNNSLLLRYALIVPGRLRGLKPPISCLIPERGGFSGRRVSEAAGQLKRLSEALRLARLVLPDLSNDLQTAFTAARDLSSSRMSDEVWVESHVRLQPSEVDLLCSKALECLDGPSKQVQDVGTNILGALADFRAQGLGAIIAELVKKEVYWPSSLFRNAPDAVAQMLVNRIENNDGHPSQLLLALAWTRREAAHAAFRKWMKNPPSSAMRAPEQFMHDAGWTLDKTGNRRELIKLPCLRLSAESGSDTTGQIPCRVSQGSKCKNCGGPLAWLFDFSNLSAPFPALELSRMPQRVLTCLHCACFGVFYSHCFRDGTATPHPANGNTDFENSSELQPRTLHIWSREWPPFAAARSFELNNASSVGGIPMWLQDSEYPNCPDCNETMPFFAQFDCSSQAGEEGIYYAYYCNPCSVAAVNYQQT